MRRAVWIFAAAVALVGCGSTGTTPAPAATNAVTSACDSAFQAAAAVDSNSDSVSDLYPAIAACGSINEWTVAYDAVNGAGFSGSATQVLGNACQAPEVMQLPLCVALNGGTAASNPPDTVPLPASYGALSSRNWAKVVKAPDKYTGKGYKLWACITQFDAATGDDTFRGDASYRKEKYWFNGENSFFVGDKNRLSDFVRNDIVLMDVVGLGSYSYDTQAGGNTTVPLFQVVKISHKGSCK